MDVNFEESGLRGQGCSRCSDKMKRDCEGRISASLTMNNDDLLLVDVQLLRQASRQQIVDLNTVYILH